MPELKRRGKEKKDSRPIVVDDFIYNDPEENVPVAYVSSDTPDEAVRKLQDSRNDASSVSAGIPWSSAQFSLRSRFASRIIPTAVPAPVSKMSGQPKALKACRRGNPIRTL